MKYKNIMIKQIAILFLTILLLTPHHARGAESNVRLVLQITIDGFRGDLINRYHNEFGDGGFRYILNNGTYYANAHYQHANTETIVGHSTLATGSFPRDHGMVANLWFDAVTGDPVYNVEDSAYPLLPSREDIQVGEQVDPSQAAAKTNGRSPLPIQGTTFSDELVVHTAGKAKVFAVSAKDRGAIPLAGHTGKAFWLSTDSGDFITSSYYYDTYPEWVQQWNTERHAASFSGKLWGLTSDPDTYLLKDNDDREYEMDLRGYGRVFPHPFGEKDDPLFNTRLVVSPIGDRLTSAFAQTLITSEKLGVDDVTDFLGISFSGVDAVNHFFGPSSLENEDVVRQLDQTLADLFRFIDETIGLERTLIVLSADHGMPEFPEYMEELGHTAGRIFSEQITEVAKHAAKETYGNADLVRLFFRPYLYLNLEELAKSGLDRNEVSATLARAIKEVDGVELVMPRASQATMTGQDAQAQVQRNYHSERSGDVYVAQKPYWFLFEKGPIGVMHGSPWKYDTYVPIIFAGPDIQAQIVYRRVHPVDIAPTLSAILGTKPPAFSRGNVLSEVFSK